MWFGGILSKQIGEEKLGQNLICHESDWQQLHISV